MVAIKVKNGKIHDLYVLEHNDRCDLKDFLIALKLSSQAEYAKLIRLFDWTADFGRLINVEKFKRLRDDIYEFKTNGGVRVFCFFDNNCIIILTNGFMKKKDYGAEIERAVSLKVKYLNAKNNDSISFREEVL